MSGAVIWGTTMNREGFMGLVDKVWILMSRISAIILIITVVVAIVTALITLLKGSGGGGRSIRARSPMTREYV